MTLSAVPCCIFSANPALPVNDRSDATEGRLRPRRLGDAAFGKNGAFDPL